MKTIIVITKDIVKGEAVTTPQVFNNIADAKRSWAMSINEINKDNPTNIPIKDYQLFSLGTFDTATLEIEPKVEFIANAAEFIR